MEGTEPDLARGEGEGCLKSGWAHFSWLGLGIHTLYRVGFSFSVTESGEIWVPLRTSDLIALPGLDLPLKLNKMALLPARVLGLLS